MRRATPEPDVRALPARARRGSRRRASPGRCGSPRAGGSAKPIWSAARLRGARPRRRAPRPGREAITAHSRARMPPIDPPSTACQRSMPSASAKRRSTVDLVADGRPRASGCPSGRRPEPGDAGPVVPWQPPRTLGTTTNQPGRVEQPARADQPDHQPGVGWPGPAGPVTWLSPVSACSTRTALSRAGEACPTSRTRRGRAGRHAAALQADRRRRRRSAAARPGRRPATRALAGGEDPSDGA